MKISQTLKRATSIIIIVLSGHLCFGQTDNSTKPDRSLIKMLVGSKKLYALDKGGHYHVWDLATLNKEFSSKETDIKYSAIAKDSSNNIFLGTENGQIHKLHNTDYSTSGHLKLKKELSIKEIFFNSRDEIFLIVPNAIYDPKTRKHWTHFEHDPSILLVKKRFLLFFKKRTKKYFNMPQYSFIDSNDRIWMTNSFGEFGGSLQIFDTRERTEIKPDIGNLNLGGFYPKSVFEDDEENIYITSGLQHFMNSGRIYLIRNDRAIELYDSYDYIDSSDSTLINDGVFVGPGAYNSVDQKIYFATTKGFYRASVPAEGKIKNSEFIFKPSLIWNREPYAIGVSMAIKRLEFTTDKRIVFLTANNGIGLYDGKVLKMLK